MSRSVAILLVVFLSLHLFQGCVYESPVESEDGSLLHPGDPLPDFMVEMSDGRIVTTADLAGQPAAILFFTVSCPDCREFLPAMQRYYDERPEVTVICIGREEPAETVAAYWNDHRLTLPYSPQPDRRVYSLFARSGVPRLYIVDSQLTIVEAYSPDSLIVSR